MELYTLVALAEKFGVRESTLRFHTKRYQNYISSVGEGKNRRYKEDALPVIAFILERVSEKRTQQQITETLNEQFPMFMDVTVNDCGSDVVVSQLNLKEENNDLVQLRSIIEELVKLGTENRNEIEFLKNSHVLLESKVSWQGESQNAKNNDMLVAISEISRVQRNKKWWRIW
jgi:DNA-binding transcriptional MerR regulator